MKKLYYALIFLIPVVVVMISIALVETITTVITIQPEKVEITNTLMVTNINSELQIIASVLPVQAKNKELTWSSSDNSLAEVSENGKVFIKDKTGDVTITTKTINNVSNDVKIRIVDRKVRGVEITNKISWLNLGETHEVEFGVLPSVNPEINSKIWSSSNSEVLSVSDGLITAKALGVATVTLWIDGFIDTFDVEVVRAVNSLNVVNNNLLTEKSQINLLNHISTLPSNANKSFSYEVNSEIASVQNNTLTFTQSGSVQVKITPVYSKQSLQILLNIESTMGEVKSLQLNKLPAFNVSVTGGLRQVNVMPYLTITPQDYSGQITLSSQNSSAVSVSDAEEYTLVANHGGSSLITVYAGSKQVTQTVDVIEYLTELEFQYSEDSETGIIETFVNPFRNNVTVFPTTATNKNISFVSSDTTIATVDQAGNVTFLQNNLPVTITVTAQDAGKVSNSYTIVSRAESALITDFNLEIEDNNQEPLEYEGLTLLTESEYSFLVNFNTDQNLKSVSVIWEFISDTIPQNAFSFNGQQATITLPEGYSGEARVEYTLEIINEYDQEFSYSSYRVYYFSNNKVLTYDIELNKTQIFTFTKTNESDKITVSVTDVFPVVSDVNLEFSLPNSVLAFNPQTMEITLNQLQSGINNVTIMFEIDGVKVYKQIEIIVLSEEITFEVVGQSSQSSYVSSTMAEYELNVQVWPDNTTNDAFTYHVSDESVAEIVNHVLTFKKAGTVTVTVTATDREIYNYDALQVTKTFTYTNGEMQTITLSFGSQEVYVGDSFELGLTYSPKDIVSLFHAENFRIELSNNILNYTLSENYNRVYFTATASGTVVVRVYFKNVLYADVEYVVSIPVLDHAEFVTGNQIVQNNSDAQRFVIGTKKVEGAAIVNQTSFTFNYRVLDVNSYFNVNTFLIFEISRGSISHLSGTTTAGVYEGAVEYTLPTTTGNVSLIIKNIAGDTLAHYNFYVLANGINVMNYAEFNTVNKAGNTIVLHGNIATSELAYSLKANIFGNNYMLDGTVPFRTQNSGQVFALGGDNLTFNYVNFVGSTEFAGQFIVGTRRLISTGSRTNITFKNSSFSNHQDLVFSENAKNVVFDNVVFKNASSKGLRLIVSKNNTASYTIKNSVFLNIGSMAVELKNTSNLGLSLDVNLVGDVLFYNYMPDNIVPPFIAGVLAGFGITSPEQQLELYDNFKPGFYKDEYILTEESQPDIKYMAMALYKEMGHWDNININTANYSDAGYIGESELYVLITTVRIYQIENSSPRAPQSALYPTYTLPWAN